MGEVIFSLSEKKYFYTILFVQDTINKIYSINVMPQTCRALGSPQKDKKKYKRNIKSYNPRVRFGYQILIMDESKRNGNIAQNGMSIFLTFWVSQKSQGIFRKGEQSSVCKTQILHSWHSMLVEEFWKC